MFFLIRFIAIVGVIFYYSPERARTDVPEGTSLAAFDLPQGGGATAQTSGEAAPRKDESEAGAFWRAIPDAARDRLTQEIARQLVQEGFALRTTLPGRDESAGVARDDAQ
jgi:hypothetical protein